MITTHVCRGNYHSTWASSGGYEPIAPFLFANENVSAYYLEFDDERSGGFEPLRFVSDDKKVVLGLVTSKSPILEEKEVIKKRIAKAAKYIPLDRLYLSPQCGFASCEIGNKLTEEEQWAKLALVKEIAQEVWDREKFYTFPQISFGTYAFTSMPSGTYSSDSSCPWVRISWIFPASAKEYNRSIYT